MGLFKKLKKLFSKKTTREIFYDNNIYKDIQDIIIDYKNTLDNLEILDKDVIENMPNDINEKKIYLFEILKNNISEELIEKILPIIISILNDRYNSYLFKISNGTGSVTKITDFEQDYWKNNLIHNILKKNISEDLIKILFTYIFNNSHFLGFADFGKLITNALEITLEKNISKDLIIFLNNIIESNNTKKIEQKWQLEFIGKTSLETLLFNLKYNKQKLNSMF